MIRSTYSTRSCPFRSIFCRIFDEYEDLDFARTGSLATEKVFSFMDNFVEQRCIFNNFAEWQ